MSRSKPLHQPQCARRKTARARCLFSYLLPLSHFRNTSLFSARVLYIARARFTFRFRLTFYGSPRAGIRLLSRVLDVGFFSRRESAWKGSFTGQGGADKNGEREGKWYMRARDRALELDFACCAICCGRNCTFFARGKCRAKLWLLLYNGEIESFGVCVYAWNENVSEEQFVPSLQDLINSLGFQFTIPRGIRIRLIYRTYYIHQNKYYTHVYVLYIYYITNSRSGYALFTKSRFQLVFRNISIKFPENTSCANY